MTRPAPENRPATRVVRPLRSLEPLPAGGGRMSPVRQPATGPAPSPLWQLVCEGIAEHGFYVLYIGQGCDCGDCDARPEPPGRRYGYTIGLAEAGLPELLHRGPEAASTGRLLADAARYALDGARLRSGDLLSSEGRDHRLRRLARPATLAPWAAARCSTIPGSSLELLELVPLPRETGRGHAAGL